MANYQVEVMTPAEVKIAIDWAKQEGWNPGLHDAECFYQTDPHGFFAGKLDGNIIAVGSAVVYDDQFAFCGFYIVDKNYRHQGLGMELTRRRLDYVGKRNAGIDGVLDMVDNYARIGYQFAHKNTRYTMANGHFNLSIDPSLIDLKTIPFSELTNYDRRHFPAPRPQFLSCWIKQPQALALGYRQNNQLKGYGVIRKCFSGYKIGPLFADTATIAEKLFEHLVNHAQGEAVFLDIPENNPAAVELVKKYKMNEVFATARMYLKEPPLLPMHEIYGITTFELG